MSSLLGNPGAPRPDAEGLEQHVASLNAQPRAVARNALSGYATLVLGAVVGFIVTPILLRELGTSGFGVWALALGAVGYLGLLEVGLGLATTTRIAAVESQGPKAVGRVLSTSLVLCMLIAGVGAILAAALAWVFPIVFDAPSSLRGDARVAAALIGAGQCVLFVVNAYSAALLGTGRMYLVNLRGVLVTSAVAIAQAGALFAGGGLEAIAALQALGNVATLVVFRRQLHRSMPHVRASFASADRRLARQLLSLGWRNSVSSVAGLIAFGSDVVLVGLLLSPAAAAAYAVALRGYNLLQRIANGVASAVGPSHAHAAAHADQARRFRIYTLSVSVSTAFALLGGVTVGVYADALLELWLGDVPPDSSLVLTVLCVVLALQMPGVSAYHLLLGAEKAGELVKVTVPAAAVNLCASIGFTLSFETVGPALGTLLAVVIFDVVVLPRKVCRMLGRTYADLVREVIPPLMGASASLAVVLAIGTVTVPSGPLVLAIALAGAGAFLGTWAQTRPGRDVRRLLSRTQPT